MDSSTAKLYEEMTIDADGGMVQNGMVLTPDENHVYVMTETKVRKCFIIILTARSQQSSSTQQMDIMHLWCEL